MEQITQSKNKDQVDRLSSLIEPEGKFALTTLESIQLKKKKANEDFDGKIAHYRNQLVTSVVRKLYKAVDSCELQNILITDVVDKVHPGPLLRKLVSGTLDIQINSENEQVVFAGTNSEKVKFENLQKFGIESFKHCKDVCEEISTVWNGLATLECYDEYLTQEGTVMFYINLSGIITP